MSILTILCVVVVAVAAEELLEAAYKKTSHYKRSLGGCERFDDVPYNLEIVNIGSGPGMHAIGYNASVKEGFNFSTAPQSYRYGFRLLRRFQSHIVEGAIVIIVIMTPLSFGRNSDYGRADYSDKYYGVLPKEDIDGYSQFRKLITKHPLAYKLLKKALVRSGDTTDKKSCESLSEPEVVQIWKKEFNLQNMFDAAQADEHRVAFEEKIQVLQEGLDYCYAKAWRPIFIIPPLPRVTRGFIGADFLDEFVYKNLDRLLKANDGLLLLDYYSEEYPDDCFQNDVFMNERGRDLFSRRLFKDIEAHFEEEIALGDSSA